MSIFVSRSLDYALRSLIWLARNGETAPVSLRELSDAAHVPRSYLAKLMSNLVKGGIVVSDAGAHGGYRLARGSAEISLLQIYEVVEGAFRTVLCGSHHDLCELHDDCTQVPVWVEIENEMNDILARRHLSDFLSETAEAFVPVSRLDDGGTARNGNLAEPK